MSWFMGVDVGTSSVKSLIIDETGRVIGSAQRKYDVLKPYFNYSEQRTEDLWAATKETLKELSAKYPDVIANLDAISYSGQMHGLILLDRDGKPLRNLIIWDDQRSFAETQEILSVIPPQEFCAITLNTLSTGYLISSLMWVKNHEPEHYDKAVTLLLPKDYIRYRMCGEVGTDMSDASSAVVFDTAKREWAWSIIDRMHLRRELFPACHESYELAGAVTAQCAAETGLREGTPISYGGGDTLMHEVGTGMIATERPWVANIGTSCQVSCATSAPLDSTTRYCTNTFCHVKEDLWILMSCNLCGGSAMKWMMSKVAELPSFDAMNELAQTVPAGSEGVLFLPYLSGGRSPDNDARARGMFFGLTLATTKAHLVRATMEGVVYGLKLNMNIIREIVGQEPDRMIASGGGARGQIFRQMEADAFNKPMYTTVEAEQSCIGAAITAAVSVGYFKSYAEAIGQIVRFNKEVTEPIPENVKVYNEYFEIYKQLYGHNKDLFWRYPNT